MYRILFFMFISNIVLAQNNFIHSLNYFPNSDIKTNAENDSFVYVGGRFTDWYEVDTSYIMLYDIQSKTSMAAPFQPNNEVKKIISDEHGGWYIVGDFTKINNLERKYIARLKSDFTLDISWTLDLPITQISDIIFQWNHLFVTDKENIYSVHHKTLDYKKIPIPVFDKEIAYSMLGNLWKTKGKDEGANESGYVISYSFVGSDAMYMYFRRDCAIYPFYWTEDETVKITYFYSEVYRYNAPNNKLDKIINFSTHSVNPIKAIVEHGHLHTIKTAYNEDGITYKSLDIKTLSPSSFLKNAAFTLPPKQYEVPYLTDNRAIFVRFGGKTNNPSYIKPTILEYNIHKKAWDTLYHTEQDVIKIPFPLTLQQQDKDIYIENHFNEHFNLYKIVDSKKIEPIFELQTSTPIQEWVVNKKNQLLLCSRYFPKKRYKIPYLARLHKPSYQLDTTWNPNYTEYVNSLFFIKNNLYVDGLNYTKDGNIKSLNCFENVNNSRPNIKKVLVNAKKKEYEILAADTTFIFFRQEVYDAKSKNKYLGQFYFKLDIKTNKIDTFTMPQKRQKIESIICLAGGEVFVFAGDIVDTVTNDPMNVKLYKLADLTKPIWEYTYPANTYRPIYVYPDNFANYFYWNISPESEMETEESVNYIYSKPTGVVFANANFVHTQKTYKKLTEAYRNPDNLRPTHSILESEHTLTKQKEHYLFTNTFRDIAISPLSKGFLVQGLFTQLNNIKIRNGFVFIDWDIPAYTVLKSDIPDNFGKEAAVLVANDFSSIRIVNMQSFDEATVSLLNSKKEVFWTVPHQARSLFYKDLGALPKDTYTILVKVKPFMDTEFSYTYNCPFTIGNK